MTTLLTVNGRSVTVDVAAEKPLLWVLREDLGLTGTKYGCGIGACRQGVNFGTHAITECQIHQMMLLYPALAGELWAHDHGLEVLAVIAQHFHVIAGQTIHDGVSQVIRCQHLVLPN